MQTKGNALISLLFCLLFCCSILPLTFAEADDLQNQKLQDFATAQRWQELLQLLDASPRPSPDSDYYRGLALAGLEHWGAAYKVFLAGHGKYPQDHRFALELAGVAFKQKRYGHAAAWLRLALRNNPKDLYANDFLAAIYFLQGNLEAALKYWNRVEKPRTEQVHIEPGLRVNPVLLDHAFAFSPASVLLREELLTTQARLHELGIFPSYRLDLVARADEKFDLQFQAQENNGFGNTKLQALLGLVRGLPYQEANIEYLNIRGSATNWASLLRWDAQKRRSLTSLSGPFRRNPKWRYRLAADLRDENWEIRRSFTGTAPALAGLNLRREALSAEIKRLIGSRWNWSAGAELSHRGYRNIVAGTALPPNLLRQGYELTQRATLGCEFLRIPERRVTISGALSSEAGRVWSTPGSSFAKIQAAVKSQWLPRAQGDDYETQWKIRTAGTAGQIPFDELFILGMERDNDLWLHGHIGTRDGRKGSAPLGSRYMLFNWETDKNLYRNGIITLKLGPLLDTGKIGGSSAALGAREWLWDTGVQSKISVLGIGVTVIYGKDLRTGNNAFYTTVGR